MNKTFALAAGALIGLVGYGATVFAADVGVSISVGQPGFYGQIDIGDYPRPRVYYSEPMYIDHRARYEEPVYLRVRPGQSRNWKKHCRKYGACGQRVYFVNDNWYNTVYVPRYQERNRHRDGGYQNRQDGRRDGGYEDRQGGHDGRRDGGHENRQGERDHNATGQRGDPREQRGNR